MLLEKSLLRIPVTVITQLIENVGRLNCVFDQRIRPNPTQSVDGPEPCPILK